MALVAHLMEEKNNFGPHLIVVPNAVLVNWKAELNIWLPGARMCVVGPVRAWTDHPDGCTRCSRGDTSQP
jgi:SNF2 family DNA or RNA helicase